MSSIEDVDDLRPADDMQVRQPPWQPQPEADYGAADYLRLPEFGISYYSLPDAALVCALDMWASGKVPEAPDGPHEWQDEASSPAVRKAIKPLEGQFLQALIRSVEAGHLKAEVRGRALVDSRLIPSRTFVDLRELTEWLEVHGHDRGDFIADLEEALQDDPWSVAAGVAEDRSRLRLSHLEPEASDHSSEFGDASKVELDVMRRRLRAQRLHIVHLEQQAAAARDPGGSQKALTTRQRRTMLVIIAAVCKKAGIDHAGRGASVAIASATADLGAPVGEDAIREMLRGIPDAVESRGR